MKQKTCKQCKEKFTPVKAMQSVCSPLCARIMASKSAEKNRKKAEREDKNRLALRKESLKTIPTLTREAQAAFNAYIRYRDADKPCISCGCVLGGNSSTGGDFDAGHYLSRGAHPELRFNEDNCHGQCKRCNRYMSGNVANFRLGLIERIGIERVDRLEGNHYLEKRTADGLREIKALYKEKLKELKTA
ncbi:MAG: recombination protein NinG [Shewanella sp.]